MFKILGILSLVLLTSCNSLYTKAAGDPAFSPIEPERIYRPTAQAGTIYHERFALNLYETNRARHVGDIITVQLVEKTDASKKAETTGAKANAMGITNPNILGRAVALGAGYNLGFDVNTNGTFNGSGESKQNNTLTGSITVTVHDVLPNGNLVIRGEKWITLNQGREFIRLTGIVRPFDVSEDNAVSSEKIANARIEYSGVGQVANTNVLGWFSKFLWSGIFPL